MWNRKLGRTADHRKALFRNMVTSLMKDSFKINDLAPFNVLYDVQHGTPETFKTKREIYIPAVLSLASPPFTLRSCRHNLP
mgnify:CR=1 FL=1